VSDVTVLNWEKAEEKRLDLATEVAMRASFAERLGIVVLGSPVLEERTATDQNGRFARHNLPALYASRRRTRLPSQKKSGPL
jgi:hypothetical protein